MGLLTKLLKSIQNRNKLLLVFLLAHLEAKNTKATSKWGALEMAHFSTGDGTEKALTW